jgi:hypothetical protein
MKSILPDILDVATEHNLVFSQRPVHNRPQEKRAICPFHTCTTHRQPEFHLYINTEKNTFKCFSCGASGGVVKFIALLDNKTEQQVLEELRGNTKKTLRRRKVHPAEKLTAFQMKAMGFHHFQGWHQLKKVWKHNPDYIKRQMDWVWREWQSYVQCRLENAYKLLLIGLMTGTYRHSVEWIKAESERLGVDLLSKVLTIYSQPVRPPWTEDMHKLAILWTQGSEKNKTAATG